MRIHRDHLYVAVALLLSVGSSRAFADEASLEGGPAHEEHEHHHHANHVAIFLGGTSGLGDMGTTSFTIGADYEHRLPFADHKFGVGVLVDSAIGSEVETMVAGFVSVHPIGGLMLLGGAGAVMTGLGNDGHFGLRGGAAYFVPVGTFSVGPVVSIDHVAGENAVVYGASFGTGF